MLQDYDNSNGCKKALQVPCGMIEYANGSVVIMEKLLIPMTNSVALHGEEYADTATIDRQRVRVTPDGRLTRGDAAKYLGYKPKTLAMWHLSGKGPRSVLVGGRRFYFLSELDAFVRDGSPEPR
jgi:hypothetical protein